jgi:hypothetical protein
MLNGWYPNILNTAECTYKEGSNCRELVEEFFVSHVNDTESTWCDLALRDLTPPLDGVCSAKSYANEEKFKAENVPMCYQYSLESSCNVQEDCIYDQTRSYIDEIDNDCRQRESDCSGPCRMDTNNTCETKTYCRAKTCRDILYEKNVESLCFDLEEPCPGDTDWSNFCAESVGKIRKTKSSEFNSMETFFNCRMYENRHNPQLVSASVPGGIPLNGMLRVFGEDVPISEYRQSFIESRLVLENDECSTVNFAESDFCDKHLEAIVPNWFQSILPENSHWFSNWLVVCPEGEDSVWPDKASAERRIKASSRNCVAYYKSSGGIDGTWEGNQKDTILYDAFPFKINCLNNNPVYQVDIDYNKWPETSCSVSENTLAHRWGQTLWTPDDVQKKFAESCSWLENGPWIPKASELPTLCDMGACLQGHKCILCSETDCQDPAASVMCVASTPIDCRDQNPCQFEGNCHQPINMLYQAAYLCDWLPNSSVTVEFEDKTFDGTISQRGLVTIGNGFNKIPRRANLTIGQESKTITSHYLTSTSDLTFLWEEQTPTQENEAERYIRNLEKCDDSQNWAEFCSHVQMGTSLSTSGPFGLKEFWSGDAELKKEGELLVREVTIDREQPLVIDVVSSGFIKISCIDTEVTGQGVTSLEGNGPCRLKSMYEPAVLKSLKINLSEQILSFKDALSLESKRSFYFPGAGENVAGFASWSFNDGVLMNSRNIEDILPQTPVCSLDETCSSGSINPRGVRWNLNDQHSDVRISGWASIPDVQQHIMNMELQNNEYEPILSCNILQHYLYVDGQKTQCKIEPNRWWNFRLDARLIGEKSRVVSGTLQFEQPTTVWDQQWRLHVEIDDCFYETDHNITSSSRLLTSKRKISNHYDFLRSTFDECHAKCTGSSECKQFSHHHEDCHLFSKRCHEDSECVDGTHTLHALHSELAQYFEIYNRDPVSGTRWTDVRVEPILSSPFNCPPITVSSRWSESFSELYEPFHPDVTSVCNGIGRDWMLMPGYVSHVCSGAACPYVKNDLEACSKHLQLRQPLCDPLDQSNTNWTSYCRYVKSFEPIHTGSSTRQIPFLGGIDFDFSSGCSESNAVMSEALSFCPSMSSDWFVGCFQRSSAYESYCSSECLDHIELMLSDNDGDPGICSTRAKYLDISYAFTDTDCKCSLGDTIITDFCLMQDAYHEGDRIKLPELANSKCDASTCIETLKDSMSRDEFRNWCKDISSGEIKGVCSKTYCECDTTSNPGVAGQVCDLNCPSGISDGEELACSGANGQCFPIDKNERQTDLIKQEAAGEVRDDGTGPDIPVWLKGPSPYIDGRCQCQLGSGISCSIPCDRCNNGTYGYDMASQYGICDAYNGICRGLAPFMRFNTKIELDESISYNTTAFETIGSTTRWLYQDRFLYEDDDTLFSVGLRDVMDKNGYASGIGKVVESSLEEQSNIKNILKVFRKMCWANEGSYEYLSNSAAVKNLGISIANGQQLNLKSVSVKASPRCQPIEMEGFRVCFANGQMYAHQGDKNLMVFETGTESIPSQKMSLAKRDSRTIFAFGGERVFDNSATQQFNDLYMISVDRISWEPDDIVFISWSLIDGGQSKPIPQIYAPMHSYLNELYLISSNQDSHTLYKIPISPKTEDMQWIKLGSFNQVGTPKYLGGTSTRQLHAYFSSQSYSWISNIWVKGELTTTQDVRIEQDQVLGNEYICKGEVSNRQLSIGGNVVATYDQDPADNVNIYVEEWTTIDVNSNANILERFLNAIRWPIASEIPLETYLDDATEDNIAKALHYVDRIYMHQARWSLPVQLQRHLKLTNSITGFNPLVKIQSNSLANPETVSLLNVFSSVSLNYFNNAPETEGDSDITVVFSGNEPTRQLLLIGHFSEIIESRRQKINFDTDVLIVETSWSETLLYVKLMIGDGSINWVSTIKNSAWVLIIDLEEWILDRTSSPFTMFGLSRSLDTWSMMTQTNEFLAYSSSHCSLTAGSQCPGLLPYSSLPCSGRGRCAISCQCVCEVAKSVLAEDSTALQNTDWNDSPFRGDACEIICPGYDGYDVNSICSSHGKCGIDGRCACDQEYTGDACQFRCPKEEGKEVCSTHGGCGTKSTTLDSFKYVNDQYMDTLTSANRQAYQNALSNYYGQSQCHENNYFEQVGSFGIAIKNQYPSWPVLSSAKKACSQINNGLTLDMTQEDNRIYPSGKCMGVIPLNNKFVPVILQDPLMKSSTFSSIQIFKCRITDCTISIDENDDRTLINLRHQLSSGSFEFIIGYEHGASSGKIKYIVNSIPIEMDFSWSTSSLKVDISSSLYSSTTIIDESESYERIHLIIEMGVLSIKLYPSTWIKPTESRTYISPDYVQKYMHTSQTQLPGRYFLIPSEDTGDDRLLLNRDRAEYDCDLEPDCLGLIQWENIFQETLYSLYTENSVLKTINLHSFEESDESYIFLKKMSHYYSGKENIADSCERIMPGQSKYPSVPYTEYFNIPIQDIDISQAQDEETGAVEIGNGVWTKCWSKVDRSTKLGCFEYARDNEKVYGFAFSETPAVCLVYSKITNPLKIKLDRYTSEQRLSLDDPCDIDADWFQVL